MRKMDAHGLCAEPYKKHNYTGKGRYFLGYLQRRTHLLASYAKNVKLSILETASQCELKQKGTAFLCHLCASYKVRKRGDPQF